MLKRFLVIVLAIVALCVGIYVAIVQPGDDRIIGRGVSPEGRDYFLVQTYTGILTEPYQVSLYLREADGDWRWHYVAHESNSWRAGDVVFEGVTARVFRGERLERIIGLELPPLTDEDFVQEYAFPADWTVEQVAAWHHDHFREH
jgi:hypothetical protein